MGIRDKAAFVAIHLGRTDVCLSALQFLNGVL
eukprot:SAG11_NODE_21590_length_422_cov_0.990712_1_plen_31_part_10